MVLLLVLAACDPLGEGSEDGLRTLSGEVISAHDGLVQVDVDVDGEDKLLLTLTAEEDYKVFVHELRDPDGQVLVDAETLWETPERSISGGVYPFPTASLAWPITGNSEPLRQGRYTATLGVVDAEYYYMRSVWVEVYAQLAQDSQLGRGDLAVNLVLAGSAAQDEELIRATEEASVIWEDLYATVGVQTHFDWWEYPEGELPGPGLGRGADYQAIAASTPLRSVNVVIVAEMVDGEGIYGMAGGIPGPLVPSDRSAVVVSAITNSGPDLIFNEKETVLYAETMAHEVGHFLGLFHPVEVSYDAWDALPDTPECSERSTCEDLLGANLMFPYPVCGPVGCTLQDELTDLQGSVFHRYAGVE